MISLSTRIVDKRSPVLDIAYVTLDDIQISKEVELFLDDAYVKLAESKSNQGIIQVDFYTEEEGKSMFGLFGGSKKKNIWEQWRFPVVSLQRSSLTKYTSESLAEFVMDLLLRVLKTIDEKKDHIVPQTLFRIMYVSHADAEKSDISWQHIFTTPNLLD